jgi:hypothetical protein
MAEIKPLSTTETERFLASWGLRASDSPSISVYFIRGQLTTIRIVDLAAGNGFETAMSAHGPGKIVNNEGDLVSREWLDRRTMLRITKLGSEYELILGDKRSKR